MKLYKAKMAEPAELLSREECEAALERASYNTFNLDTRDVYIDSLAGSGVGAMSAEQWAAIIRGNEACADSELFARLAESVRDMMGLKHVVPTHQGRGVENVFYGVLSEDSDVVPNNPHSDTTRARVINQGAEPVGCPSPAARDPNSTEMSKGNSDINAGYTLVEEVGTDAVPVIVLTVTNNSVVDQPVSMVNIRATIEFVRDTDAMFTTDACRLAENAHFVKTREAGREDHSVVEIAYAQFEHADATMMSGKKDALVNIGGFAAARNETVSERTKQRAIPYEGFPIYGGLPDRDVEAMAIDLHEAVTPLCVIDRVEQVAELGDLPVEAGAPVYQPTGEHAACLDAGEAFPHIPEEESPGQELVCALYPEDGVRGVGLSGFVFPGTNQSGLVRFAPPRHTYSREHLGHAAKTVVKVMTSAGEYGGFEIAAEPPVKELQHFSSWLEPVSN